MEHLGLLALFILPLSFGFFRTWCIWEILSPAILNVVLVVDVSGVSNSGSPLATELVSSSESTEVSLQMWLRMGYQLGCDSLSANSNYSSS